MDRITVIRKSQSAFISGIIGCIPVLGLGSAIYALVCRAKIRRQYHDWNPAEYYLKQGALLGWFGVLLSVLAIVVLGYCIANSLIG